MLTPVFKIEQTDEQLIIEIHAPYANVKDADADYCDRQFFFISKPYFLKLYLPAELNDIEPISGTYDCDKGTFTFKASKKNIGEFFPSLDLINELLKPSEIHAKRLVEESDQNNDNDDNDDIVSTLLDEPQQLPQTSFNNALNDPIDDKCLLYGYGFACSRHGVIEKFDTEIGTLLDLTEPENSLVDERVENCLRYDQLKFNAEHYIADLMEENPLLDECLQFEYPKNCFDLSFESRDHLKDLPRRNLTKYSLKMEKLIALSLIDILFAYLYDMRTTNAEHSSESGWTITKLSPTLCYFVRWKTAKESLIGAIRRSLCYPLYRHWNLSMKVMDDLKFLLSKGKVALLQCLIDTRTVLSTSGDFRYLMNDLYITDYCLWIQSISDDLLLWLYSELNHLILTKNDVQLDLEELELEAHLQVLQVTDRNESPVDSDDEPS